MTHKRSPRPWILTGITTITLATAACSTVETAAPPKLEPSGSAYATPTQKPPVDNHAYEKARTSRAPKDASGPAPEVTVTVTATPTMDPPTDLPQVLEIPAFDIVSDVVPVGKDASGGVAVPDDISTTGWYERSAWIGAPQGSIVLVGHRDSAVDGAGALYGIEQLEVGDSLVVSAQDGAPQRFRVSEIKSVEKTKFSTIVESVFDLASPYRLTLITCGGDFDSATGSYLSNIIVTAYPE